MNCPRCKSRSYVHMYKDEIKCMACGHTGYQIPSEILEEFTANMGKVGKATKYIRSNSKKYYP